MWMVLDLEEAVYTEYDQLLNVRVDVVDDGGAPLERRRIVDALSAEGIVRAIRTDRFLPMSREFLAQVCRDHAPGIHSRYVAPLGRHPGLAGGFEEVERRGSLSAMRFALRVPRSECIMA